MATMTKSRKQRSSQSKGVLNKPSGRVAGLPDVHPNNLLPRAAEPPEEWMEESERPEFREQCREEAPDAGIRDIYSIEGGFTQGRSRS